MASEQLPFCDRLRDWRRRSGLTQSGAADALSVGRTYYSKMESGRKSPGKFLLEKFDLLEKELVLKEHSPVAQITHSSSVQETSPDYDRMKNVIYIREHASPETLALVDSFLRSVREQLNDEGKRK